MIVLGVGNAIHTYAGMRLRLACAALMERQGHEEPTGGAKLTPGFDLPAEYVLHTVGPIVYDRVGKEEERLLASCYHSCLELAARSGIRSVAFCCISTGEFRFPREPAARIAIDTVEGFLQNDTSDMEVIFNVFKDEDRDVYRRLLA